MNKIESIIGLILPIVVVIFTLLVTYLIAAKINISLSYLNFLISLILLIMGVFLMIKILKPRW